MVNLNIFGTRARHIRIMGIIRLGYHGSTETIREAAKNNEKSISERLVQAIEGERENTRPPENKKQGKRPKTRRTNATPFRMKKEKSPTPKREVEKQRNSKRKSKRKREANNSSTREKEEKKA